MDKLVTVVLTALLSSSCVYNKGGDGGLHMFNVLAEEFCESLTEEHEGGWYIGGKKRMQSGLAGLSVSKLYVYKKMQGVHIVGIAEWGLAFSDSIERIWVDDGVKIAAAAFAWNVNMKELRLPADLTEIPVGLCSNCVSLNDIAIPNSVTRICQSAFYGTGLVEVHVPDSVTEIEENAFFECRSLRRVLLPKHVAIADNAFEGCDSVVFEIR